MKTNYNIELSRILKAFNDYYGFNIIEKTRKQEYFFARCIFYKVAKYYTKVSLTELGSFTGVTHASVINALNTFDLDIKRESLIKNNYDKIIFLYSSFFENNGAHTEREMFNSQVFLNKYDELKSKNQLLELELIREKQNKKEVGFNHKCISALNSLPIETIKDFYQTRFLPYARINKIELN